MKQSRPFVLRNATVFDGSGTAPVKTDVLVRGQRILEVGPALVVHEPAQEINLRGWYLSPGWMDLHTHVFAGHGVFSVAPEDIGLRSGVTTLVDAGSAGAMNFEVFERSVIRSARETLLAYVNIASTGLPHGHAGVPGFVGDHIHRGLHSRELATSLLENFSECIVGWKARLTAVLADNNRELEWHALNNLLKLRDETARPVMVHHIESSIPADDLLGSLGKRDVYTHLYHGRGSSIFDRKSGAPTPAALAARDRGVIFDVGHGSGAFQWEYAEKAGQQFGFWPDTISSDLHRYNLFHPVRDLATTMTKFFHLGLPLERIIAMVTGNVAAALGNQAGSGRIQENELADLTIFGVMPGDFCLPDAANVIRKVGERIQPLAVFKCGELVPCSGFFEHAAIDGFLAEALQAVT